MNPPSFDRVTRLLAARRLSRRQTLARGGAGLAAGALAAAGLRHPAGAQAATPPAAATGERIMFLFLQAFQGGRIAPKEGAAGRYTLTLERGLGQTVYFSDRPERLVGASPTPRFLAGLGFPEDNPPNAALVVEGTDGATEVAVVELFDPSYDEATHTATYEVAVLEEWENELDLGLTKPPADLAAFGSSFGAAHLFIDDCAAGWLICDNGTDSYLKRQKIDYCWPPNGNGCTPCSNYDRYEWTQVCNQWFPEYCNGHCEPWLQEWGT